MFAIQADVAELVDARVSEARGREAVMVRFHSSAPKKVASRRVLNRESRNWLLIFLFAFSADLHETPYVHKEFVQAIRSNQQAFGLDLSDQAIGRLADYYDLVVQRNPLLHLVGPCSPEEFAIRHILESLELLEYLPEGARFADIGAGAGLPSIPCLLVREDLRGVLIESKKKKSSYLQNVLSKFTFGDRVEVIDRQFSEVVRPDVDAVTCRALDKFTQKLPPLIKWSADCKLLFFGGPNLQSALNSVGVIVTPKLIPMSENRFLFIRERK